MFVELKVSWGMENGGVWLNLMNRSRFVSAWGACFVLGELQEAGQCTIYTSLPRGLLKKVL